MLKEVEELVEKLRSHREELLDIIQSMPEEQASLHPNGDWSVKQQLAHLSMGEPSWLRWALSAKSGSGGTFGPELGLPAEYQKTIDTADQKPLAYWIAELKRVRDETWKALNPEELTQDELQRKAVHRVSGEMTTVQFLRAIYRHDRMHIDQVSGRPSSFRPRGL